MRTNIVKCVSEKKQRKIYKEYKKGANKTKKALAEKYDISVRTLGRIINNLASQETPTETIKVEVSIKTPIAKAVEKESKYAFTVTQNEISVFKDGLPRTVTKDYPDFKDLRNNLVLNDFSNEVLKHTYEMMDMKTFIETFTEGLLTIDHKTSLIKYGTFEVEHELVSIILGGLDKGKKGSVLHLIKFLEKLIKNPKENIVEELYPFLRHNDITITPEGNILAYKRVTDSFLDCYTKTIDNSVGSEVVMPRSMVNDDPEQTCSTGLHFCAFSYVQHFHGARLVKVEVSPEDVVSIPTDYNGAKGRCCKYKVVEDVSHML